MTTAEHYEGSIYGIDRQGEVAVISVYRKGSTVRMSRIWPDARIHDHPITFPGRTTRSEAEAVFNLLDVFEVAAEAEGSDQKKQLIKELEQKAAELKIAHEASAIRER